MKCFRCGADNPPGGLACRSCAAVLPPPEAASSTLDLVDGPLFQGLIQGETSTTLTALSGLCDGVREGAVDEDTFVEGVNAELERLEAFILGLEAQRPADDPGEMHEALALFRVALEGFTTACVKLHEYFTQEDATAFDRGLGLAREASGALA